MSFSLGHRPALDGIRGCAIALVVALHIGAGLPGGFIGVEVFFVLSGFVITSVLLEEARETGRIHLGNFYARRGLRLLPALFGLLIVLGVYVAIFPDRAPADDFGRDALAAVFYVANWLYSSVGNQPHLLTHTWSLSVEEQFYLVWPLILIALVLRRSGYATLLAVCVAGIMASTVLRYVLWDGGPGVDRAYFGTDTRIGAMLVGCAVAILAYAGWLPRQGRVVPFVRVGALVGCGLILVVARELHRLEPVLYKGGFTAVALATGVIIVAILIAPRDALSRALSIAPLRYLGKISYGVYLWGWPLHFMVRAATPDFSHTVRMLITISLSIAIPAVSFRYLEQPFLRLKGRFHSPKVLLDDPAPVAT
jgi:peptidoglycan/LPS O-acetylase OafA/YrhL